MCSVFFGKSCPNRSDEFSEILRTAFDRCVCSIVHRSQNFSWNDDHLVGQYVSQDLNMHGLVVGGFTFRSKSIPSDCFQAFLLILLFTANNFPSPFTPCVTQWKFFKTRHDITLVPGLGCSIRIKWKWESGLPPYRLKFIELEVWAIFIDFFAWVCFFL